MKRGPIISKMVRMARVLLIDDDKETVEANRHMLEINGHEVQTANTAKAGGEILNNTGFDVVVLDLVDEDESLKQDPSAGFNLVKDMRTRFPAMPIIALTGLYEFMSDEWKEEFEHDKSILQVHRFMEKPVAPSVLVYELEALLKEVHK